MRLILSKIGQHFTEKEIKDMISTVDKNKDGMLSFDGKTILMYSISIFVAIGFKSFW